MATATTPRPALGDKELQKNQRSAIRALALDPLQAEIRQTRAFLTSKGVDLNTEQQTKTRTALEYFAQNR